MRTVVAASDGLVYCDDGSVWTRCVPSSSRGEWVEREPIPGTSRAEAHERERSGSPQSRYPWLPKEAA